MSLAIINARLIDPAHEIDMSGGIRVVDGRIAEAGTIEPMPEDQVINAGGQILAPALVDLRAAREPAHTADGETLASLAASALAGGVGTLVLAPNELCPLDDPGALAAFKRAAEDQPVRLLTACGATKDLGGEAMAELGLMAEAGAIYAALGDRPITDSRIMRRILAYAAGLEMWLASRPADPGLSAGAVALEGDQAARFGLPSEPAISERIGLDRDASLAELSGGRLFVDRLSTADGLAALKRARARDIEIAASCAIAHLVFNEVDAGGLDSAFRIDPPLRAEADRQALIEAVRAGEIEAVVSDHRPTPVDDKADPFAIAASGSLALETLLAALLGLVHDGELSLVEALRPVTCGPADLMGLEQGRLTPGAPADFILIDGDAPWVVDPTRLASARSNTAWAGRRMTGRVTQTFIGGREEFNYNG